MDEDLQAPITWTRWAARTAAGVLVVAAVSVGAWDRGGEGGDERVVTAAGATFGGVDTVTVPSTVVLPSTTAAPPSTVAGTSTSPSTQPPRTTTTNAAAPTTATAPTTSTTARRAATTATVTLANDYTYALAVTLNGHRFELAPGQQTAPFDVALAPNGNDIIEARIVAVPTCGFADVGGIIPGPGRYRVAIVTGRSSCLADPSQPFPGPSFETKPA